MLKNKQLFLFFSCLMIFIFGFSLNTSAMHIMEGYLPIKYCISWAILCVPFLILGVKSINNVVSNHRKALILLAMAGAYTFVLSSLKIPSVTGSCSHPTGTGFGAILFGPFTISILGIIVLLFQAILLSHGGLTTLGANTFSMAIAGPILTYGVYKLAVKFKLPKPVAIFLGAALGNLFTYCITAFQLALAHHSDATMSEAFVKFLGIFAVTQIPIAIIEGILTAVIFMGLESYAKGELLELGYFEGGTI